LRCSRSATEQQRLQRRCPHVRQSRCTAGVSKNRGEGQGKAARLPPRVQRANLGQLDHLVHVLADGLGARLPAQHAHSARPLAGARDSRRKALSDKLTPCKLRRAARRRALEPAEFRQRSHMLSSGSPVKRCACHAPTTTARRSWDREHSQVATTTCHSADRRRSFGTLHGGGRAAAPAECLP